MCEPTTLAIMSAAIGVAGQVASYASASQQASQQQHYQDQLVAQRNQQMQANYQLALQSQREQSNQVNMKLEQERIKGSNDMQQVQLQRLRAQSEVMAGAAAGGVSGLAISSLLDEFSRQEGTYRSNYSQNLAFIKGQTKQELLALRTQASGRIQDVQPLIPAPVEKPSFLPYALGAAGDIVGGMQQINAGKGNYLYQNQGSYRS